MTSRFLLVDTGFLVALMNRTDKHHERALSCREELKGRNWITSWPVLTETSHLVAKIAPLAFDKVLLLVENGTIGLCLLGQDHLARVRVLMRKYADLPMDLADASLVILAEDLNCGDIVSTDQRDFQNYRFKNRKPFRNLLLPN